MKKEEAVKRIPMPSETEIQSLPEVPRTILSGLKDGLDLIDYKAAAYLFVEAANGRLPGNGVSVRYANPRLDSITQSLSVLGEFNSDRIPISTYEKMSYDPIIAMATAVIELEILAQSYRIVCEDHKIADFVSVVIEPIYRDVVKSMLKAIRYGFATGEKVYVQKKVKITKTTETGKKKTIYNDFATIIKKVKFAHPTSIRIHRKQSTEEITHVSQKNSHLTGYYKVKSPMVPIKKMLWFAPEAEYGNVFGESRYKNAYQAWYWGNIIFQFMMKYLERRGSPSVIAKVPPGYSTDADGNKVDNITLGLKAADSLNSNSVVAIPNEYDKNTNKPKWELDLISDGDQRGDMFIAVLEYLNKMKANALFVPYPIIEGGSNAGSAESQVDIHVLSVEALMKMIEDSINNSLIKDLVEFNFSPRKQYPCFIKIERLNYDKRNLLKDVFVRMLMMTSSMTKSGYKPNWIPSIKSMADFLEVPIDEFEKIFIENETEESETAEQMPANIDMPEDDNSLDISEKKDNKDQANADAVPRKDRSARERRREG